MIKRPFIIDKISRLLSRNKIDILYFIRYRIRILPILITDRLMARFWPKREFKNSKYPLKINKKIDPILANEIIYPLGKSIIENKEVKLLGRNIPIDWPPKWENSETGEWPKCYSEDIKFYSKDIEDDIKIIWEFHRLQWLPSIAAYSVRDKNNKLSNEIIDLIINYINNHPKNKTISWMEGIEITLRSISIIETLSYLKNEGIEDQRISLIHYQLGEYAKWINNHLSQKWRLNNNHLILELVGLVIIGSYMEWHPKSEYWIKKGISLLKKEISQQTTDGRNWEPTTAYHRFVTESLLVMKYYAKNMMSNINDIRVINEIIQQSIEVLEQMSIGEYSHMPLLGDDDAGIVIPKELDMDFRSNYRVLKFAKKLGFESKKDFQGLRFWKKQGMGVIQSKKMMIHFVSGAPEGKYSQGSHRHLDMLSLSINSEHEEIILDGGTGLYFGNKKIRDFFRSERSHSGIYSKNSSWAKMNNLFEIKNPPIGKIQMGENKVSMSCMHPSGIVQKRNLEWTGGEIEINDPLELESPVICFLVKEIGEISTKDGTWEMRLGGWRMTHRPLPSEIKITSSKVKDSSNSEDALYSPSYGIIDKVSRIEFFHEKGVNAITKIKVE